MSHTRATQACSTLLTKLFCSYTDCCRELLLSRWQPTLLFSCANNFLPFYQLLTSMVSYGPLGPHMYIAVLNINKRSWMVRSSIHGLGGPFGTRPGTRDVSPTQLNAYLCDKGQTMFKIIFLKQSDESMLGPKQTLNQSINQYSILSMECPWNCNQLYIT